MFKRVFAFIATIDHIKYNLRLVFTRQVSETNNVFFSMQKSLHYCLVYSSASKGLDNNWITDLLNTFPTDRPSFSAFRRERFFACKNFSERPWALQAGERERGRSERGLALLKINKCRTSGKPLPDSSQSSRGRKSLCLGPAALVTRPTYTLWISRHPCLAFPAEFLRKINKKHPSTIRAREWRSLFGVESFSLTKKFNF